ncbi:hypothetical protein SUGI_0174470 [Cryptomeria japonica]|uniref:protein SCARECROW 1 n=1 Tax=Cryptomeria japonica TaxID=3369 RepID=UPI00240893D8|nr:protein SCARECROW 1 [Cryptomeria japonica]GLJ11680.1 hypothetical protein SUGI_0174470 [Cryptomeria japonica]
MASYSESSERYQDQNRLAPAFGICPIYNTMTKTPDFGVESRKLKLKLKEGPVAINAPSSSSWSIEQTSFVHTPLRWDYAPATALSADKLMSYGLPSVNPPMWASNSAQGLENPDVSYPPEFLVPKSHEYNLAAGDSVWCDSERLMDVLVNRNRAVTERNNMELQILSSMSDAGCLPSCSSSSSCETHGWSYISSELHDSRPCKRGHILHAPQSLEFQGGGDISRGDFIQGDISRGDFMNQNDLRLVKQSHSPIGYSVGKGQEQGQGRGNAKFEAENSSSQDEEGLQLLSLLLQCAEAVSENNIEVANAVLPQLTEMTTPYGNCLERVAAYFAEGISSRVVISYLGVSSSEQRSPLVSVNYSNILAAFQAFNGISPFVKFSHFTSNQAILEAFEGERRVHIIDFDIMQGLQWPALFHILAARPGGCPHVRITGMGTSMEALQATGKRLSSFARTLRLPFEFHPVAQAVGKCDPASLGVRNGDALAVHWLHHSLYDVTGSDVCTLHLLQRLRPKVITMVEQDITRTGSFLERFVDALHYYSAMFDSLGACFAPDNMDRHLVEQQLFSHEIKNILGLGGPAQIGDIKFDNWRTQLHNFGFRQLSMKGNAFAQAQLLLNMFPCEGFGYSLVEEQGILKLGWKGLPLYTASAWSST